MNHGGPDKAVLAYASKHYEAWYAEFPDVNFDADGFGENVTISDIDRSGMGLANEQKLAASTHQAGHINGVYSGR